MKKFIYDRLITLVFLIVILASCTFSVDQDITPSDNARDVTDTLAPLPTQILLTDTPLPAPTDTPVPIATETPLPPTITPKPTDWPTPPPTQPPAVQTTNLQVDVSNMSNSNFEVPANTNLTLRDTSNDRKANKCRITGTGGYSQSIDIPLTGSSERFKLPAGDYLLSCEVPNKTAKIRSR